MVLVCKLLAATPTLGGRPKPSLLLPHRTQPWSSRDTIGKVKTRVIVDLQVLPCDVSLPIPFGMVSAPQGNRTSLRKEGSIKVVETTAEQTDGIHHPTELHRRHAPLRLHSI
jgi:hypothetical protein